jgi:hypothetical protein
MGKTMPPEVFTGSNINVSGFFSTMNNKHIKPSETTRTEL